MDAATTMLMADAEPFLPGDTSRKLSQKASDIYNTLTFETNAIYNKPPPAPWVSFLIGGIFCGFT